MEVQLCLNQNIFIQGMVALKKEFQLAQPEKEEEEEEVD
jgi:hypothetical protein